MRRWAKLYCSRAIRWLGVASLLAGILPAIAATPRSPVIDEHPASLEVAAGQAAVFSVSATGNAPLSYRWIFNNALIPQATNSSLVIPNVSSANAGNYNAVVFNSHGFAISRAATLTVLQPTVPVITNQPQSQTVLAGSAVTLGVGYSGNGPFGFQWRRNGINIPDATNSTFSMSNIQPGDAGDYSVVVFTSAGAALSEPAAVRVIADALPFTDSFDLLFTIPLSSGSGAASNFGATREAGEPAHAGRLATKTVWIGWQPNASGIATISLAGSNFDTLLAVYTGDTLAGLTEVASDDDSAGFHASALRFNATAGTHYKIVVAGAGAAAGDFYFAWSLTPTAERVPVVTRRPASQTVALGSPASFFVEATPPEAMVQWLFNGEAISGATGRSLEIASANESHLGTYSARVTLGAQSVTSAGATLQINVTGTTSEPVIGDDKLSVALRMNPIRLGDEPVPSSKSAGAVAASTGVNRGYTGTQLFSTVGAVADPDEPIHCGIGGGASFWFAYIADYDGELMVNTDGSSFDTILAIYTGDGNDYATLQSLGCDDNSGADGQDSRVAVPVQRRRTYFIVVDGVNGASGTVRLNYSLATPASLRVVSSSASGTLVRVTGQRYGTFVIEACPNSGSWAPIVTNTSATGSFQYLDARSAAGCLYRGRTLHP